MAKEKSVLGVINVRVKLECSALKGLGWRILHYKVSPSLIWDKDMSVLSASELGVIRWVKSLG